MSADLTSPSSQAPRPDPENLTLEDLRKNPLVREFAGISEEVAKHHSAPRSFLINIRRSAKATRNNSACSRRLVTTAKKRYPALAHGSRPENNVKGG